MNDIIKAKKKIKIVKNLLKENDGNRGIKYVLKKRKKLKF